MGEKAAIAWPVTSAAGCLPALSRTPSRPNGSCFSTWRRGPAAPPSIYRAGRTPICWSGCHSVRSPPPSNAPSPGGAIRPTGSRGTCLTDRTSDAFQWAPHRLNPLLAASMIRLARAFVTDATEDRGSWLATDDPRIVETGDLASAVHRLVSSPLPETDPVRDEGRRARPPVTSGLSARLSRRLATPTADRLAASLAEPVHRALDRPDVPDRLVDEIQRLIDRVRSYERWSPSAWRRSWPRRPPPVAASPAADGPARGRLDTRCRP